MHLRNIHKVARIEMAPQLRGVRGFPLEVKFSVDDAVVLRDDFDRA